jgi:hypothetical protein
MVPCNSSRTDILSINISAASLGEIERRALITASDSASKIVGTDMTLPQPVALAPSDPQVV